MMGEGKGVGIVMVCDCGSRQRHFVPLVVYSIILRLSRIKITLHRKEKYSN